MLSGGILRIVAVIVGAVFFATVGVLCLFRTAAVRDFAVRNTPRKLGAVSNPAWNWMQTPQYTWSLRLIGLLAIGALILLLVVIVRSRT
jgi:hypothetical protein